MKNISKLYLLENEIPENCYECPLKEDYTDFPNIYCEVTGNIINGLSSGGALSLSGWNAAEYTSRGTGFTGINAGVSQTTSFSAAVGNSGGQDIIDSSITQSKEEASQSVSGQESEESDMMEEIRANVNEIAQIMKTVFDGGSLRVTVQNYGLTGIGSSTL